MKLELNPLLRLCFGFLLFACMSVDQRLYASDNAGNYESWTNGANAGTGFGNWIFENNHNPTNVYAGGYLAIPVRPA